MNIDEAGKHIEGVISNLAAGLVSDQEKKYVWIEDDREVQCYHHPLCKNSESGRFALYQQSLAKVLAWNPGWEVSCIHRERELHIIGVHEGLFYAHVTYIYLRKKAA